MIAGGASEGSYRYGLWPAIAEKHLKIRAKFENKDTFSSVLDWSLPARLAKEGMVVFVVMN